MVPRDPVELLSAASNAAGHDVSSPEVRDQLLQYAHNLYTQGPPQTNGTLKGTDKLHPTLLPLLHTLHKLHPEHLPTLLLLSCAYYAADNYAGSLWYNNLILRIDPNYVESMSNIGTTLRALGRYQEAESWWWRAIRLRPGYWDAYENLLGVMCSANPAVSNAKAGRSSEVKDSLHPSRDSWRRFSFANTSRHTSSGSRTHRARRCRSTFRPVCRLRKRLAFRTSSTPRETSNSYCPSWGTVPAAAEYQKAVEVVLSPNESTRYGLRDFIVAACAVGLLSMGAMLPGTAAAAAALEVAVAMGINPTNPEHAAILTSGSFSRICPGGILALVKLSGDVLVSTLLRLGNGQLPMLLLLPEAATQLCKVIFAETAGCLPALARPQSSSKPQNPAVLQQAQKAGCTDDFDDPAYTRQAVPGRNGESDGRSARCANAGRHPAFDVVAPASVLSLHLVASVGIDMQQPGHSALCPPCGHHCDQRGRSATAAQWTGARNAVLHARPAARPQASAHLHQPRITAQGPRPSQRSDQDVPQGRRVQPGLRCGAGQSR
ncbi:hypothetical protein L1887_61066 [Cichorium endivia]|nr:hypothetical protein L1887_61066 [Cichorium endivia]